ncbi:MAG: tetraacyldisaccharide 4'-kinase [Terracidiphilus sp.]
MSDPSPARRLLWPLVPAYRLALAARELRLHSGLEPVRRLRWPVISVGSLSAGGAGKTPLTIALAKLLSANGYQVDVLSRGFGRQSRQAARVRPEGSAEEFGDEPLLIARDAGVPVYVAPQRHDAGLLAEIDLQDKDVFWKEGPGAKAPAGSDRLLAGLMPGPTVHLLDDGFQHRQLARDLDILLLSRQDWHDHLLPAGNLREPRNAARRASVIVIPAEEPELQTELVGWGWRGPIWRFHRRMEVPAAADPLAAFCGIARPQQFFRGLESAGLSLVSRTAFPDHHRYTAGDFKRIAATAKAAGATALITTEKDKVRLEQLAALIPMSLPLLTARLDVEIEDEIVALRWLESRLKEALYRPSL